MNAGLASGTILYEQGLHDKVAPVGNAVPDVDVGLTESEVAVGGAAERFSARSGWASANPRSRGISDRLARLGAECTYRLLPTP